MCQYVLYTKILYNIYINQFIFDHRRLKLHFCKLTFEARKLPTLMHKKKYFSNTNVLLKYEWSQCSNW